MPTISAQLRQLADHTAKSRGDWWRSRQAARLIRELVHVLAVLLTTPADDLPSEGLALRALEQGVGELAVRLRAAGIPIRRTNLDCVAFEGRFTSSKYTGPRGPAVGLRGPQENPHQRKE